jgi:hypothetical protein
VQRFRMVIGLALAIVLGMLLGAAAAITQAAVTQQGGMISGCLSSGAGNGVSVKMGGRAITPTSVLVVAQPCADGERQINLPSYVRTFIVSPTGTDTENGQALLAARNAIEATRIATTTAYLIKLEAGNYNLGNNSLSLLPNLDLEGSGEGTTVISSTVGGINSSANNGTILMATNSELRFLSVTNNGTNSSQAAVYIPNNGATQVRLAHVNIFNSSGIFKYGIFSASKGTLSILNSTISTSGEGNQSFTIRNNNGGTLTIANSTILASGSNFNGRTGLLTSGTTMLQNSVITISGENTNGGVNSGIMTSDANLTLLNSTVSSSSPTMNMGLNTGGSTDKLINIHNSLIKAYGGANFNHAVSSSGGTVTVRNSSMTATGTGTNTGWFISGGIVTIGNSELSGLTKTNGSVTCFSVHDTQLNSFAC